MLVSQEVGRRVLATRSSLLATCSSLLATCSSLLATCCSLLATRCELRPRSAGFPRQHHAVLCHGRHEDNGRVRREPRAGFPDQTVDFFQSKGLKTRGQLSP